MCLSHWISLNCGARYPILSVISLFCLAVYTVETYVLSLVIKTDKTYAHPLSTSFQNQIVALP